MGKIDFAKYKDVPTFGFQPFSPALIDIADHPKWDIPDKLAIILAPTGGLFLRHQNPYQPYSTQEIIDESIAGVEAGACSVHVHVRDDNGIPTGDRERTRTVVTALRDRFGKDVHIDGEPLFGDTFEEMMQPIVEDLYECAAVNCFAAFLGEILLYLPPQTCKATAEVLQACGKKPILAVYNPGDIDNAYRWLIRPGIVKPPFYWGICPGLPGGAPMWDPLSMADTLLHIIRRIKDVDDSERPFMVVAASGRASSYLTTLAIVLGCHVRVGKEDTIYQVPHSDDVIVSNRDVVEQTAAIARQLQREPMSATEYRSAAGLTF